MCIVVTILPVEKETAATLRVQIPEQYTKATTGQVASQVNGCGTFADTTFDTINSNLFQKLNLITKLYLP